MLDVTNIRKDFRFFDNTKLAYLDNSATSQRPERVIEAEADYYRFSNANPFRGLYDLSIEATEKYEEARRVVAGFIGAKEDAEVIFTRNASESLNLAAFCLGELLLEPGDEIITTVVEHHSNMLPWQHAAKRKGATVKYLTCGIDGEFSQDEFKALLSPKTKIVAMTHMSNIFGRIVDVKSFADAAHAVGAVFVLDGSQSVPHIKVDVKELGVDFLAFSGHKMMAPMGIGVLYGKREYLEKMPPFLTGGEMIEHVSLDEVTYAEIPHKFEAGTVNGGGAVALAEAVRYIEEIGMDAMSERELYLTELALKKVAEMPHVTVLGGKTAEEHHGIITFKIDNVHPHDVAAIFADGNVAVRAGHHCAEPLHQHLGIPSTTRASIMFYNTEEEVERFCNVLAEIRSVMGFK